MKLHVIQEEISEPELTLRCRDPKAPEIERLLQLLRPDGQRLPVQTEEGRLLLDPLELLYGEYVGRSVFLYTKEGVFPTKLSLAQLETEVEHMFRCSKSMVVNLMHIRHLQSELSGRILATLSNEERIVISRHFAAALRKRLAGTQK